MEQDTPLPTKSKHICSYNNSFCNISSSSCVKTGFWLMHTIDLPSLWASSSFIDSGRCFKLILWVEERIRTHGYFLPTQFLVPALLRDKIWYEAVSSAHKIFQAQVLHSRVQAWPKPLIGARLNQNLYQVAADETAQAQNWINKIIQIHYWKNHCCQNHELTSNDFTLQNYRDNL